MPYIKALGLIVSEEKIFLRCSYEKLKDCRNWPSSFRGEDFLRFSYEKTDKPSGGAILGPGVIIFRNLIEDHPRNIPVKFGRNWPSSLEDL